MADKFNPKREAGIEAQFKDVTDPNNIERLVSEIRCELEESDDKQR